MKAIQSDVRNLLEGSKQYVLPLYQRRYSWGPKHWQTLAEDLDRLIREPAHRSHFLGSFVSAPMETAAVQSVIRFRLIDGQQRLTTLVILLAALRDVAESSGESNLAEQIQGQYLTNLYQKGEAAKKLILTSQDRTALDAIVVRPATPIGAVGDAYVFFADHFSAVQPTVLADVLQTTIGRLAVVNITLEQGDDPHMIFESLNAKGERLTQSDLLRNYFLMRLPPSDADAHFEAYWQPMEDALGDDLTGFLRHFLMRDLEGGNVRRDQVYFYVKDRVDHEAATPAEVVAALRSLHRFAMYYARLVNPQKYEEDAAVADRSARLHDLRSTTAYPFLMNVMDAVTAGRLPQQAHSDTLDLIESFLVRRLTCGVPSNQLRKIFLGLCGEAARATNATDFALAVRDGLSQRQWCPTDAAFRSAIVRGVMYGGPLRDIARYVLNRLERSQGHKEATDPNASTVQVEHVLPQTLTDAWRSELSPDDLATADAIHEQWVDRLGNLTLTGYNPELGNKPYAHKRTVYADSHFALNKYFAGVDRWDATAIEARGEFLAGRAIALWPDVSPDRVSAVSEAMRRRAKILPPPTSVTIEGVSHATVSALDAAHQVFAAMRGLDADRFAKALTQVIPPTRRGPVPDGMRSPRLVTDVYVDLHGSGAALRKRCRRLVHAMGLPAGSLAFEPA